MNDKVIEEFRANHGKVGGYFEQMELLLLTTTGAKSGQLRVAPLGYTRDGDKLVVIASKGGADTHPDWYFNVLAHPEVTVEVGDEKFTATATVAEGADRDRLYAQQAAKYPVFSEYQQKTKRDIPVVVLSRV